jgi:2-polyprenyl-3-methyl-5-hydroxy-6-metoxy-1,4-benzoquinol methylase
MRILGLGVGYGEFLKKYKANGNILHGVDKDVDRLREAKKLGIQTKYADINDFLPNYPRNYFDLVVCNHVIEHLHRPDTMLTMLQLMIKPNGTFLINTPNLAAWHCKLMLLIGIQPLYTRPNVHLKIYTYRFLKSVLSTYNWKVVRHSTYSNNRGVWYIDILDWLFSFVGMGSNLSVTCKKKI